MEKINRLSLPVTILIASVVLGGFYYVIETKNEKQKNDCIKQAEMVKNREYERIDSFFKEYERVEIFKVDTANAEKKYNQDIYNCSILYK